MTDQPRIYLAGPIRDRSDDGRTWRDEVGEKSWAEWVNPLDKYDPREGGRDVETYTDQEIVDTDLAAIDRCDAILVRYDGERTWGTPMEVLYASQQYIPVAVAWLDDSRVNPWVTAHADYVAPSLARADDWLFAQLRDDVEIEPPEPSDAISCDHSDDLDVPDGAQRAAEQAADHAREQTISLSGDKMARMVAEDVATLLTDSRDTHGDAIENTQHIAHGWNWYLQGEGKLADGASIDGTDVAALMTQLKLSRNSVGDFDVDHLRDVAGYASIGAACAVDRGDANLDELQVHAEDGGGGS